MIRWTPGARLGCTLCGAHEPLGPAWRGCAICGGPLAVDYAGVDSGGSIEDLAARLTPIPRSDAADLGQGDTPLVAADRLLPGLALKLESQNPTGSHKDRFHAITAGVARGLGAPGLLTSSTGNHGASAAAFAAAAGLRSAIFLHREAPASLRCRAAAHGAEIAILDGEEQAAIAALADLGWCPSTAADPRHAGRSTPYGQEGYKAIAYEIAGQLGEMPAMVAVPVSGGDTIYGIWRGFKDLQERLGLPMPRLLGCQPAGCATLKGVDRPCGETLALSATGERAGSHASRLVERGEVEPQAVSEEDLEAALLALARAGFLTEPASALTLAGLEMARRDGHLGESESSVAVITASGQAWTERLGEVWGPPAVRESREALFDALSRWSPELGEEER